MALSQTWVPFSDGHNSLGNSENAAHFWDAEGQSILLSFPNKSSSACKGAVSGEEERRDIGPEGWETNPGPAEISMAEWMGDGGRGVGLCHPAVDHKVESA